MEISGKTAIVTGAASGIGLGIATALAEAGANVVMADIQKDAVKPKKIEREVTASASTSTPSAYTPVASTATGRQINNTSPSHKKRVISCFRQERS